jgi:hypothetical protein
LHLGTPLCQTIREQGKDWPLLRGMTDERGLHSKRKPLDSASCQFRIERYFRTHESPANAFLYQKLHLGWSRDEIGWLQLNPSFDEGAFIVHLFLKYL